MATCKNCGAELEDGTVFCGECGQKVEQKVSEPSKKKAKKKETQSKLVEEKEEILPAASLSNKELLANKIQEYTDSGNFEAAKKTYQQLKDVYKNLPLEYTKSKRELINTLVELNNALTSKFEKSSSKEVNETVKEINRKLRKSNSLASSKKFEEAEKEYIEVRKLYDSIPLGYSTVKTDLREDLLRYEAKAISTKASSSIKEVSQKSAKINVLIRDAYRSIKKEDLHNSIKKYAEIKHIYSELPEGFLQRKFELSNKISLLQKEILSVKTKNALTDLNIKYVEITNVIKNANKALKNKNVAEATDNHKKAKETFKTLPEGFIERKAELKNIIVAFDKKLSKFSNKLNKKDMDEKSRKIRTLIDIARGQLRKESVDLAGESYHEAMTLFQELPDGFLQKKTQIETVLNKLHRAILIKSDIMSTEVDVDDRTKILYRELLKLLTRIRIHIRNEEFDTIERDYMLINEVYNKLPIGFLQKKLKIYDEIVNVYNTLKLYKHVKKMDNLASTKKFIELEENAKEVEESYKILVKKLPEDKKLFDYVNKKQKGYKEAIRKYKETGTFELQKEEETEQKREKKELKKEEKILEEQVEVKKPKEGIVKEEKTKSGAKPRISPFGFFKRKKVKKLEEHKLNEKDVNKLIEDSTPVPISKINELLKHAEKYTKEGDFEQANKLYTQIEKLL